MCRSAENAAPCRIIRAAGLSSRGRGSVRPWPSVLSPEPLFLRRRSSSSSAIYHRRRPCERPSVHPKAVVVALGRWTIAGRTSLGLVGSRALLAREACLASSTSFATLLISENSS
ncbi:hypothetical protein MRX96_047628 [Rhipicephalus microplus]